MATSKMTKTKALALAKKTIQARKDILAKQNPTQAQPKKGK